MFSSNFEEIVGHGKMIVVIIAAKIVEFFETVCCLSNRMPEPLQSWLA